MDINSLLNICKEQDMKIRIGDHDLAILNRGMSRRDKRFLIIVDDKDENFTNGANGGSVPLGKLYMQKLLDDEADKAGASKIVKGSTCRIGGNLELYTDDSTALYNAGEFVLFMDTELGEFLIANGLATAATGW